MKALKTLLLFFIVIAVTSQVLFSQMYPPGGAYVTQPVQFRWPSVPNAASYAVSVYNNFNLIRYAPTTDTTITLSGFPENVELIWRVVAKSGFDSAQSMLYTFTVVSTPPLLYIPPNNTTACTPVKFIWYKMTGAVKYGLRLYQGYNLIYYNETTDSSLTVSPPAGTYSWGVRYFTNEDTISSEMWNVYITSPPPVPVLFSPPNGGGVTYPVKLIWNRSQGAVSYNVQVSFLADFTTLEYSTLTIDSTITLTSISAGIHYWRVKATGNPCTSLFSSAWHFYLMSPVKKDIDILPNSFKLYDSYPNPFNPTTTIRIDIPKECEGKFIVYNALGEEVGTLLDEHLKPGAYYVTVTNDNLSSGLYFYRFVSELFSDTKKMVLIK
ncbi:MAG: T9SS C-terminal target domain-containing protein [Ignavibacteriae bacterium]|nr:MAG: T9SS C-terminal target domain-containing protein [Ignavibacteriota bacterium]